MYSHSNAKAQDWPWKDRSQMAATLGLLTEEHAVKAQARPAAVQARTQGPWARARTQLMHGYDRVVKCSLQSMADP